MYTLSLTLDELSTLIWLAMRGYFPEEIANGMTLVGGYEFADYADRPSVVLTWEFPEAMAWSLLELRENDPDAYLACLNPASSLWEKIQDLENKIV